MERAMLPPNADVKHKSTKEKKRKGGQGRSREETIEFFPCAYPVQGRKSNQLDYTRI